MLLSLSNRWKCLPHIWLHLLPPHDVRLMAGLRPSAEPLPHCELDGLVFTDHLAASTPPCLSGWLCEASYLWHLSVSGVKLKPATGLTGVTRHSGSSQCELMSNINYSVLCWEICCSFISEPKLVHNDITTVNLAASDEKNDSDPSWYVLLMVW